MKRELHLAILAALIALLPLAIAAQGKQRGNGKRAQEHQRQTAQQRAQRQQKAGGKGVAGQGLLARFDQLDTNKDGQLSASEGASVRWFTPADTNKDNIVTRAEASVFSQNRAGAAGRGGQPGQMGRGAAGRQAGQAGGMRRPDGQTSGPGAMVLMAADTNKDGKLSHDEFKTWPRSQSMPDLFLNADGDKDGLLTAQEIQAEMAARRKAGFGMGKPGGPGQAAQPGAAPGRGNRPGRNQTTSATAPMLPRPPK